MCNMTRMLKDTILIGLMSLFISASASNIRIDGNDSELEALVASANHEMNGDFDNKNSDGSFKQTNSFHLEMYDNSVAYVSVFINSYIDAINSMEDYKNRQLEIFRYVDTNPHFKELLNYLLKHDLPLYMYSISKDGKQKTSVVVYDKTDLEQFGVNYTENQKQVVTPLQEKVGNIPEFTVNVECGKHAIVDSLFTINYIVSYEGKDKIGVKFIFDKNEDNHAKLLYFDKAGIKSSVSSEDCGYRKYSNEDTYTATWRALKPGKFVSPSFIVTVRNGLHVDTLDIQSIRKTIKISNTDRKIVKQKEKERKEVIRLRKNKDSMLGVAELEESEYQVGDTIHCIVSLLNEVADPACDVQSVAIDDTFVIKGCDYKAVPFDEAKFEEMELNGKRYYKIRFAEISISPQRAGVVEIPRIKLTGYKLIQMWKKDKFWGNLPEIIENYQYGVYTNPLKVLVK